MPKRADKFFSDLLTKAYSVTTYLSYGASFNAIHAAVSTILCLKSSYFENELLRKTKLIFNLWTRALFRVNGVSIDSWRLTTKGDCV